MFIHIILSNLQRCPHSVPGICRTWRSGMISFDLTGNQEKGLGRQWVEKLGQTTQWMMTGLYVYLCVWLHASASSQRVSAENQTSADNFWSWHGRKWTVFFQFMILTFQWEKTLSPLYLRFKPLNIQSPNLCIYSEYLFHIFINFPGCKS